MKHKSKNKESKQRSNITEPGSEAKNKQGSRDVDSGAEADFEFFSRVLDTIPPTSFFSEHEREKLVNERKSSESESDEVDGDGKAIKRTQKEQQGTSHKKLKPNPLHNKTVSQIQFQANSLQSEETYSKIKEKKKHKKNSQKKKSDNPAEGSSVQSDKISLLRQSLDNIQKLSAERKLTPTELQERKRLKRKESKLKSKIRKKKQKPLQKTPLVNGGLSPGYKSPERPSVVDKEGKLVFSKFDFTKTLEKEKPKNSLSGKDYRRLLEKIEKRNSKIETLKEKDFEKGKKLAEKAAWQSVMLRAEGQKVKDDPALLKKAIKKKEKLKEQKKKKWVERQDQVKKGIEKRQEKRQKNIQERKQAKKDRKINKAKKKGHIVPGF